MESAGVDAEVVQVRADHDRLLAQVRIGADHDPDHVAQEAPGSGHSCSESRHVTHAERSAHGTSCPARLEASLAEPRARDAGEPRRGLRGHVHDGDRDVARKGSLEGAQLALDAEAPPPASRVLDDQERQGASLRRGPRLGDQEPLLADHGT